MVQVVGGLMKYKIIYEDNHLLIIDKEVGLLSQADDSLELDILTHYKKYLKDEYQKPGNVYLGLVHRLDRNVGGVMVLAKTSKAASRLSEQIRTHQFQKFYLAITETKPAVGIYEDYLVKNEKINKSTITTAAIGKLAKLEVIKTFQKQNLYCSLIALFTGRHHQIRVQLSSRKTPLYGDIKYNQNAKKDQHIGLYACGLIFIHPVTKNPLLISNFSQNYPFNLFQKDQKLILEILSKYHSHVDII